MKPAKRYKQPIAGKWEQPIMKGYLLQCCDCALVHRMDFRVIKGHVQFRVWRHKAQTNEQRKARRIKVKFTQEKP